MIQNLKIQGYRCFRELSISELGKVNLIVGQNNSGKTSLLEALHFLASGCDPSVWWNIANRRGEAIQTPHNPGGGSPTRRYLEIKHAFSGHQFRQKAAFAIMADEHLCSVRVTRRKLLKEPDGQILLSAELEEQIPTARTYIEFRNAEGSTFISQDEEGTLAYNDIRRNANERKKSSQIFPSIYLPTGRQSRDTLQERWSEIALTSKEEQVIEAVRIIEPRFEKIAFLGGPPRARVRVKLKDLPEPVPLGSLGDGVRRIFALALSMVCAEGGFLLIDEIETGLYYRLQEKVWRFLHDASRLLNVQIFATTHSHDSIDAFVNSLTGENEGKLLRLSRKNGTIKPVFYSPEELKIALEHEVEVR